MSMYRDYLMHHGIMGMRWGVHNGPPYPLDKKLSRRIQKGHNEKARISAKEYQDMRSGKIKTTKKDRAGSSHAGSAFSRKLNMLTARNGSLSLYLSAPQIFEAASDSPAVSTLDAERVQAAKDYVASLTDATPKGGKISESDLVSLKAGRVYPTVNPAYTTGTTAARSNCVLCTNALALRSLGYNVEAGETGGFGVSGMLSGATEYYWDGAIPYKERGAANVEQRLRSFGNKGKGEIVGRYASGGGHSIYFQNERGDDGKYGPVFYDGQSGQRYRSVSEMLEETCFDTSEMMRITRLDTATPNWKHMSEDNVFRDRWDMGDTSAAMIKRSSSQSSSASPGKIVFHWE